jgi:hypothetical protein
MADNENANANAGDANAANANANGTVATVPPNVLSLVGDDEAKRFVIVGDAAFESRDDGSAKITGSFAFVGPDGVIATKPRKGSAKPREWRTAHVIPADDVALLGGAATLARMTRHTASYRAASRIILPFALSLRGGPDDATKRAAIDDAKSLL